jgi:hypothetical protein
MSGDIHIKLDDSWYERWRNCSVYFGQRSSMLRQLVKKLIVQLESQPVNEIEVEQDKKVV